LIWFQLRSQPAFPTTWPLPFHPTTSSWPPILSSHPALARSTPSGIEQSTDDAALIPSAHPAFLSAPECAAETDSRKLPSKLSESARRSCREVLLFWPSSHLLLYIARRFKKRTFTGILCARRAKHIR